MLDMLESNDAALRAVAGPHIRLPSRARLFTHYLSNMSPPLHYAVPCYCFACAVWRVLRGNTLHRGFHMGRL